MRTCYPGRNLERLEKRIFNMYDENRDGRISFAEFMVVMYVMSNGTPEENFKQIFRILDADGNGVITLREGGGRLNREVVPGSLTAMSSCHLVAK